VDTSAAAETTALAAQARIYGGVAALCLRFPKCTAIQAWGFTDKYSWAPRAYRGNGAALPFDASYKTKPAYEALQKALSLHP
jgi:endo-1,4-beta-xylanase